MHWLSAHVASEDLRHAHRLIPLRRLLRYVCVDRNILPVVIAGALILLKVLIASLYDWLLFNVVIAFHLDGFLLNDFILSLIRHFFLVLFNYTSKCL